MQIIEIFLIAIGVAMDALSAIGVIIGNRFGNRYEKVAKIIGGTILIIMGAKILFEHLCV